MTEKQGARLDAELAARIIEILCKCAVDLLKAVADNHD